MLYTVSPVSKDECVVWISGALNYSDGLNDAELRAFQDQIIQQDLRNLESHSPQLLPLNTPLEFYTPSDRTSLVYRRWLKQLGVSYGTI